VLGAHSIPERRRGVVKERIGPQLESSWGNRSARACRKSVVLPQAIDTCGDSDDVFADANRARLYVTCRTGFVETFGRDAAGYHSTGPITRSAAARISLSVPELDRLYVALRGQSKAAAAIWV
jgi:hypothetical protein